MFAEECKFEDRFNGKEEFVNIFAFQLFNEGIFIFHHFALIWIAIERGETTDADFCIKLCENIQ